MLATSIARKAGYDQVLWTDAFEHKYLQEVGVMNVFFLIGNTAITPSLEEGTILAGITRDSAIQVLRDMGYQVEERPIQIDELISAHKAGTLREIFGTGTAATIAMIQQLTYRDYTMQFDTTQWEVAPLLKKNINNIRDQVVPDTRGWLFPVNY